MFCPCSKQLLHFCQLGNEMRNVSQSLSKHAADTQLVQMRRHTHSRHLLTHVRGVLWGETPFNTNDDSLPTQHAGCTHLTPRSVLLDQMLSLRPCTVCVWLLCNMDGVFLFPSEYDALNGKNDPKLRQGKETAHSEGCACGHCRIYFVLLSFTFF